MSSDLFAALRQEYLEGARTRLVELRRLVAAPGSPEALAAIRQAAHQLRGSGGFYGFVAISAAAAVVEELALAALGGDGEAGARLAGAVERLAQAVAEAQAL